MDNSVKILLLKIIKFNGDISPLVKMGYGYSQIAEVINSEISEGNVQNVRGVLEITQKGDLLLEKIIKDVYPLRGNNWIEPEIESKIPQLSIDFLFLPNQNELTFRDFKFNK